MHMVILPDFFKDGVSIGPARVRVNIKTDLSYGRDVRDVLRPKKMIVGIEQA